MSLLFSARAGCHISKCAFKPGIIKALREEGGREMSSQRSNKGILERARAGRCLIPPSHHTATITFHAGGGKKGKKKKSNYKNELFLEK